MRIREIKIHVRTIQDVHKFVNLASKYDIDADVYAVNNGRHVVPANSILGIFSLDLTQDLKLVIVKGDENNIMLFVRECESAGWVVE